MRIEIVEPRQSWTEDFESVKRIVMQAAPAGAYLHHIGSTAVPGLIKDPVFDIIVDGANEWAKATGWSKPPGD